ncbi:MAG: Txe/YoeB family addiction module toxin [Bacteroidales bacterium]|nr:Txe/YoeB family addiction module toxin [Bacteroidales bacterium]
MYRLFGDLSEHPRTGIGKPEQLKYLKNTWSRRIDSKHRMVYTIEDDIITISILSLLEHYGDK